MTPIRQALHTAARYFAREAQIHFIQSEIFAGRSFQHAVTGHQIDRILAETRRHTHIAMYHQTLDKANRTRKMIK